MKIVLRDILDAVDLLYNITYFSFNGQYYKRIHGTPIGSPVLPILADIVMTDLEEKCLNKLNYTPSFYFRYANNILLCIPKKKVDYTLKIFNSYNNKLKFTSEMEINKSIFWN